MKSSKGKGLLGVLITLLAIGLFGYLGYDSMDGIKLGLDLEGGVSITYQTVVPDPSAEDMSDTIYKLQQRVQNYSSEAAVYQEGGNRINIDIPGVSDANEILEDLGTPGSLVFTDEDWNVLLTGDQVSNAKAGMYSDKGVNKYLIDLTFTPEGALLFEEATANNLNKKIYIIYDDVVQSDPVVRSVISGGNAQITDLTSFEEAEKVAATIRIGSLSLELEELRSNVVGAQLGQEAIDSSLKAGAVGFAVVILFMLIVYLIPGLAASLALCLYVGVILILLEMFEVTLTLPGIAGIILSIGMAVDANVIIFTRIKEEIGFGKTVDSAIKTGFHKAMSAIIDGNVTTLLAAAVLYWKGSGTVKGFASTLALGIVLSMFTALFVTKNILKALYNLGFQSQKFYGLKKERKAFDFLGKRNICFVCSAAVILVGIGAMVFYQSSAGSMLNYGMDFTGGTSTNVTFNEDKTLEELSAQVVLVISEVTGDSDVQTQKVAGTNEVIIKTKTLSVEQREALENKMVEHFGVDADKITMESISGAVSREMKQDAIIAVILATFCMLLYIWFRFSDIRFAASAVLALIHDVLIVLAFYAVLRWSVGSNFIACMLTIVGYSINATIVIFDRIRENLKMADHNHDLKAIVNTSITQTFTRSINTSFTTFITIFFLFIMGVSSIREFALPLMVGIVGGTYSSVCLTGAIWYVMTTKLKKKEAEE